jgi:hypothetical protein
MQKTDRVDLKRRAPGAALGLATARFGDWVRSFPGCDRMNQLVLSPQGPCTDSRMSNGYTIANARQTFPLSASDEKAKTKKRKRSF